MLTKMRLLPALLLLPLGAAALVRLPASAQDACFSQARCRGRVLYKDDYVFESACASSGGRSMKIKNTCYNLVVSPAPQEPAPSRPRKPSLNIGDVCLEGSCECVNGTTIYMNQRCGG